MLRQNPNLVVAFVAGGWGLSEVLRIVMIYSQVWGNNPKMRNFSNLEDARNWIAAECPTLASMPLDPQPAGAIPPEPKTEPPPTDGPPPAAS